MQVRQANAMRTLQGHTLRAEFRHSTSITMLQSADDDNSLEVVAENAATVSAVTMLIAVVYKPLADK